MKIIETYLGEWFPSLKDEMDSNDSFFDFKLENGCLFGLREETEREMNERLAQSDLQTSKEIEGALKILEKNGYCIITESAKKQYDELIQKGKFD
jgi:hypothetical protein